MDGALTFEISCSSDVAQLNGPTKTFVVGQENELLISPLARLLDPNCQSSNPSSAAFNPLVLVGATGAGKTTLLQAIIETWSREFGPEVVRSYNVVDFGRDLQSAHGDGSVSEWYRAVGSARLLAIDGLERSRQRSNVSVALRNVIDSVLDGGGFVVVASQTMPASLFQLDAGVRDRLSAGLVVQLQWPGEEARKTIVTNAAEKRSIALSADEVNQLAATLRGSVARIESAVAEIACPATIANGSAAGSIRQTKVSTKQIIAVVSRYLGVPQAVIVGKSRRKTAVYARSVVAHLARRLTDNSFARIGRELGGRDHTTIMHADRSIAAQTKDDPETQQAIELLERLLATT